MSAGFCGADRDLAPRVLAAGLADPDMVLAQPTGEDVGGAVQVAEQAGHVGHRALGEVDGLVRRDVAAGLGGEQGLNLGGGEPLGLVGPAPVGEDLGVLGDDLAPVIPAGQLHVHAEPDQQQRGPPRHGRGTHHAAPPCRAQHRRHGRVQRRLQHVAGDRGDVRVGAVQVGRPGRHGRSRKNGSGSACPVTSASRRPAGSAAVAARNPFGIWVMSACRALQRFGGEGLDLGGGAEAGAHLGQLAGDLGGLDSGLGVLGAGLAFAGGGAVPVAVQVGRGVSRPMPSRASCSPGASRSSRPSRMASTTSSLRSGTGTEMPSALRICACLRSSTSSTIPSMPLSVP